MYAAGFRPWVIAYASLMTIAFVAIYFTTGAIRAQTLAINARRAIVLFGVIPAIAGIAVAVMLLAGFGGWSAFYALSAVILLANFVYWARFDRSDSEHSSTM